jgi:hypothetical protein
MPLKLLNLPSMARPERHRAFSSRGGVGRLGHRVSLSQFYQDAAYLFLLMFCPRLT